MSRLPSLFAVLLGIALVAGLVVPTGAIVSGAPDEGRSGAVALEPTSEYAGLSGGELVVEFERVNREATSRFDSVFAITAREERAIRLESDVEGVSFYRGGGEEIVADDRLGLEAGETVSVGMRVETTDVDPESGTITVYVEDAEPAYAVGSRVFTGRLIALVAVPIALGLLVVVELGRRRRDLWPVLP